MEAFIRVVGAGRTLTASLRKWGVLLVEAGAPVEPDPEVAEVLLVCFSRNRLLTRGARVASPTTGQVWEIRLIVRRDKPHKGFKSTWTISNISRVVSDPQAKKKGREDDMATEVSSGESRTVASEEEGAAARVRLAVHELGLPGTRLGNYSREGRWGYIRGTLVLRSAVTGAYYAVDGPSARFFRSANPDSTKMTSDTPRGVIHQDRPWLFKVLTTEELGQRCLARQRDQHPTTTDTDNTATNNKQEPMTTRPEVHPSLAHLRPTTKVEEIVIRHVEHTLELAPHQIAAALRGLGLDVPDGVKLSITNTEYLRLRWATEDEDVKRR